MPDTANLLATALAPPAITLIKVHLMTTFRGSPNTTFITLDGTPAYSSTDGLFELDPVNLPSAISAGLALVDPTLEARLDAIEARLAALES
jgi:hypothetical protein